MIFIMIDLHDVSCVSLSGATMHELISQEEAAPALRPGLCHQVSDINLPRLL